jgi:two-component system chemotaxis response regulator CheY
MNKTLLVTDDAMLIRTIVKDAATKGGWEVVAEAANGQEAIDEYQRTSPTAVTLDLIMPEFDGLHALRGIMQLDPAAKVVIVSALNQQSLLKEAFDEGATDFVCKPFDRDDLIATLSKLVSEHDSARIESANLASH